MRHVALCLLQVRQLLADKSVISTSWSHILHCHAKQLEISDKRRLSATHQVTLKGTLLYSVIIIKLTGWCCNGAIYRRQNPWVILLKFHNVCCTKASLAHNSVSCFIWIKPSMAHNTQELWNVWTLSRTDSACVLLKLCYNSIIDSSCANAFCVEKHIIVQTHPLTQIRLYATFTTHLISMTFRNV